MLTSWDRLYENLAPYLGLSHNSHAGQSVALQAGRGLLKIIDYRESQVDPETLMGLPLELNASQEIQVYVNGRQAHTIPFTKLT